MRAETFSILFSVLDPETNTVPGIFESLNTFFQKLTDVIISTFLKVKH